MNRFQKAMDYYLKQYRSGVRTVAIGAHYDGDYWLTDGWVCHRIPESEMELNPAILKKSPVDVERFIKNAEKGELLKDTKTKRFYSGKYVIAFSSDNLCAWVDERLIKTFDYSLSNSRISLVGAEANEAIKVQNNGVTAGIIMPVRVNFEDEVKNLFALTKKGNEND